MKQAEGTFGTTEDPRFHNTWKLLKKYRDAQWNIDISMSEMRSEFEHEYESSIEDFLESAYMAGADLSGTKLERHIRTVARSNEMIKIVNRSVDMLKKKPKHGEKYYWLLFYTYLSPNAFDSVDEIIQAMIDNGVFKKLSRATYFRMRKEAVAELDSILWGYASRSSFEVLNDFVPENVEE